MLVTYHFNDLLQRQTKLDLNGAGLVLHGTRRLVVVVVEEDALDDRVLVRTRLHVILHAHTPVDL